MKKTFIALSLIVVGSTLLSAQKPFIGTIEYSYEMKGDGAEMMAAFMPEKMVIKYGNKSMSTYMEGGMMGSMMGKIVVNGQSGESFVLKEEEKTAYLIEKEDIEEQMNRQKKPRVEALEETITILDYACQKYKIVVEEDGQEMVQYIWVADKLRVPKIKSVGVEQIAGIVTSTDIPGLPLKIEMSIPDTDMAVVVTATRLDNTKVPNAEFERPEDYAVKDFSEMLEMGNE